MDEERRDRETAGPEHAPGRAQQHGPEHGPGVQHGPGPEHGPGHAAGAPAHPVQGGAWAPAAHGAGGGAPWLQAGGTAEHPVAPSPPSGTAGEGRRRGLGTVVAVALLAGVVGGGAGFGGAYALLADGAAAPALTGTPSAAPAVSATPGTVAGAAAIATPSTVDIRVALPQGVAEGSGVVLTADGAVLTNNHVVEGGRDILVTLADGTEHPARVVGTAPSYDLAVLRIDGVSGLTPATLGRSEDVQVGEQVVAIGSPQGLTGTVTTGIVSALGRTVGVQGEDGSAVVYNGLQTDAPINQGNSGGPLVNLEGQVVGINSAIATAGQATGSIGLGFAIPVDQARRVSQEILATGSATKPVLGVQGGLAASDGTGALIQAVQPGSPAEAAGIVAGETVTRVGDARVEDFADLVAKIGAATPGETVQLTVQGRDGAERTVRATLGSVPDEAATTSAPQPPTPFGGGAPRNPFGGN